MRGIDFAGEMDHMVFVKFLPSGVTEETLDQLIPGSISVDIATNRMGVYKDYAYLTYKSPEEARQVAEKYRDIEMDGNKLLVVHYGTYYVDKPKRREYLGDEIMTSMPDEKRIEILRNLHRMRTNYEQQCSSMSLEPFQKRQMKNRMDSVKNRLRKDAKLRVTENKPMLGMEKVPGLVVAPPVNNGNANQKPQPIQTRQTTQQIQGGNAPRQQQQQQQQQQQPRQKQQRQQQPQQQQTGSTVMPDATAQAMSMIVGLLSSQLGQQMPQQLKQFQQLQQQPQQQQRQPQQQQQQQPQQQQQQQPQQQQHQQKPMATTKWLKNYDVKLEKRRLWNKDRRMKRKQKKVAAQAAAGGFEGGASDNAGQQLPSNNMSQQLPNNNMSQQLPNNNTGQQLLNNNTGQQQPNNNISVGGYQDTVDMYTGTTDFCDPQIGGMCATSFGDNGTQWQQKSGTGCYADASNNAANSYASNNAANSYASNNVVLQGGNNYSVDPSYSQDGNPVYQGSAPMYQDNGTVNTQQMMADGGDGDQGGYSRKRKGNQWKRRGGRRKF